MRRSIALRLAERACWRRSRCARLADPTVEQFLPAQPEPAPAPDLAPPALILAKLARLLPAVLAAPLRPDVAEAGPPWDCSACRRPT